MDLTHILNTLNFSPEPKVDCQLEHDSRARSAQSRKQIDAKEMEIQAQLNEYTLSQ